MEEPQVIISMSRYNELLKIEEDSLKGIDIEIINDEAISDALQSLFRNDNPQLIKKMTGVEIAMIDHPATVEMIRHNFKKLLIIKKPKKPIDEKDRSPNSSR